MYMHIVVFVFVSLLFLGKRGGGEGGKGSSDECDLDSTSQATRMAHPHLHGCT